jgi:hypothetical protein
MTEEEEEEEEEKTHPVQKAGRVDHPEGKHPPS